MSKIIITCNNTNILLPKHHSREYNVELFCKLIYYGYSKITLNGKDSTPKEVKFFLKDNDY